MLLLIGLLAVVLAAPAAFADSGVSLSFNGQDYVADLYIENGVSYISVVSLNNITGIIVEQEGYVPLRQFFEDRGAKVNWDAPDNQMIVFMENNHPDDYLTQNLTQENLVDEKKEIQLSTGIEMKYLEMGNKEGQAIILIHGVTDSSRSWSLAAPYLADEYHILVPDLRGHGDTERTNMRSLPIHLFAEDVVALMDARGIETAVIVGHSMGSYVAQAIAINYPEKVESLILVSSADTRVGKSSFWETLMDLSSTPIDHDFIKSWLWNPNPVDETFLNKVMGETSNLPPIIWQGAYKGIMTNDHSSFLADIEAPTLILWGSLDSFLGEEYQEELRESMPNAKFITINNVEHNIQWEQPKKIADYIRIFLTGDK